MPSDIAESLQASFEESTPIDTSRSELNNFLASRDKSPIRSSLSTPWDDAGETTKRYYVKKASEVVAESLKVIREIKFDVYGKRQTAKMKLLPSVFSSLYSRIKIFVFAVNSKRHFSIFLSLI